ncbi:hypothetical protein SprV_0802516200 [Sparganum proliferum]
MPSSDTSSGGWSESGTEESMSSTSLANERSSSLEASSVSTDEEVGSTAEVEEEDASPRESLRKWALRLKIPHSHVNELLKALKPWLPDLPADARTLLGAKYVSAPSTTMVSGEYMHLGLANQVNAHLRNLAMPSSVEEVVITMSERPHRQGKPNRKYLGHYYLGDESLPTTPSASDSSSDLDTSTTIPKGQSPNRSNAQPISSTPKRKRRRHDYSHSDRIQRKQKKRSEWTIAGIKKLPLGQREMKAEMAALREEAEFGCLPLSNGGTQFLPSQKEYFSHLFSEDVAEFLTFYGRKAGTRGFFESPVYSVTLEVFNRWNKDHHSDRQQLENAFKNAFKKGHDRYQRKCQRASTSRQSQDPATTNADPTMDNGENQQ